MGGKIIDATIVPTPQATQLARGTATALPQSERITELWEPIIFVCSSVWFFGVLTPLLAFFTIHEKKLSLQAI